jgi:pimeloyl-ACP methyl ester carboxylesterase
MKRPVFASVLAAITLWFSTPSQAAAPPELPKAAASFNAGSLHVDVYGTAGKPAVVFIPGLTCGPWEWSSEIRQFAQDYMIYALTLPGFDGNAPASGDPFTTATADFWTMLQQHNVVKPIVIGHSLGGTLGFLLAEQHPDRLRGLIAVDGMPVFPGMELAAPADRKAIAARMSAMLASISTPAQFEFAEKAYSLPYMVTAKSDIESIARLAARSDPKATARWMQDDVALDLRPQLSTITIPVLEIAPFDAQSDPARPAKIASAEAKQAYYASLLAGDPSAAVAVIEPSRHFVMYDQPRKLHAVIVRFLRSALEGRPTGTARGQAPN